MRKSEYLNYLLPPILGVTTIYKFLVKVNIRPLKIEYLPLPHSANQSHQDNGFQIFKTVFQQFPSVSLLNHW